MNYLPGVLDWEVLLYAFCLLLEYVDRSKLNWKNSSCGECWLAVMAYVYTDDFPLMCNEGDNALLFGRLEISCWMAGRNRFLVHGHLVIIVVSRLPLYYLHADHLLDLNHYYYLFLLLFDKYFFLFIISSNLESMELLTKIVFRIIKNDWPDIL